MGVWTQCLCDVHNCGRLGGKGGILFPPLETTPFWWFPLWWRGRLKSEKWVFSSQFSSIFSLEENSCSNSNPIFDHSNIQISQPRSAKFIIWSISLKKSFNYSGGHAKLFIINNMRWPINDHICCCSATNLTHSKHRHKILRIVCEMVMLLTDLSDLTEDSPKKLNYNSHHFRVSLFHVALRDFHLW